MLKKLPMAMAIGLGLLMSQSLLADTRTQAKRIHDRLTGVPPTDTVLDDMVATFTGDPSGAAAAEIAMSNPAFANVTLKNFAAPWTNEEQTVFTPLNDYTATVIGLIRDGDKEDFRQVLYGDVLYTGDSSLSISSYSNSNNNHYTELEALGPVQGDLSDDTILIKQAQSSVTGLDSDATAGVMTSRAGAKAFYYLGTNRAMFRFTLMNHLCTDLEPLKDNTRSSDRVRQDVSRSPGGDSRIYLNSCVGCHAGMDGLAGAYAYYELDFNGDKDTDVDTFENSATLTYATAGTPAERVTAKHLINENNFKPGYITTDDSWINYWRNGQNALLGWNNDYPLYMEGPKSTAVGNGAKSMGMELAHSDAFAQCQVKKAFQAVCLRDSNDYAADRSEVDDIVTSFKSDYNMKNVFRDVAAYCKGE